ncbi:MAG: hypothetical protein NC388_07350 [Clostridium sp.]|nr:hypothetical protein [Clostridium sp.]
MSKSKFLIGAMSSLLFTSCASIFCGSKAKVTVKNDYVTTPVNLSYDGRTETSVFLPYTIKIKRGFKPTTITASAKGYEDTSVNVKKSFNKTTLWNILLGGIPGFAIDAATGSIMKPSTKEVVIPLREDKSQRFQEVILPEIQNSKPERVSRDNAGDTSLERTIIRWYFESDPQGARIFWRVISSVPDEVRNTNELYLGTTPYEDTRSFNIIGLTEENARDVQIEIKIKRKGFMDQTKRFNVRQAIDQQEISSFFELVKEE